MTTFTTVEDITSGVADGVLKPTRLVQDAIAKEKSLRKLNAFLHVNRDAAMTAATDLEQKLAAGGPPGKLAGLPIGIKDALCTTCSPTTAGSKILTRDGQSPDQGWRSAYDATVVRRLREAGAIVFGKLNMDEFAMGSSNENSAFGVVRNPWDESCVPGGSSGGSATAVASGVVSASLGSDTGGSIRQPAGLTGVVGVKPSYGRVSRYGLIAFASSLDQVGPFATDVAGAARLLEVIAGHDPLDSTSSERPVGEYETACSKEAKGLRIGVPKEYFSEGLTDEARSATEAAIDCLRNQGCEIVPVTLPHSQYGVSTYYLLATAEASSNLSRFDGIRYGLRVEEDNATLASVYGKTRNSGFGPEVKRRIMLGTFALSTGYYDAYYKKAQKVRTLIRRDFDAAFQQADVLLTPSAPGAAFNIGADMAPLEVYMQDVFTVPASLAGIAGISVPAALTGGNKPLPLGVQFLAPAFAEETMFRAAACWERHSPVRLAGPAL